MWKTYAEVLGNNITSLLDRIASDGPFSSRFRELPKERPVYELAARISFEGVLTATRKKGRGHLICGVMNLADDRPLLKDLATYIGLATASLDTPTGPQDIFNEFWNIVTGLIGAAWSENGFEINFSTPCALSGQIPPLHSSHDVQAFHLEIYSESGPKMDILAAFREHGRPAA